MVLPYKANAGEHGEPPRLLTEEEQILLAIDQGIHEVNDRGMRWSSLGDFPHTAETNALDFRLVARVHPANDRSLRRGEPSDVIVDRLAHVYFRRAKKLAFERW